MANIKAAKKAIRSSKRKQKHNIFWKNRFKNAARALNDDISEKKEFSIIEERYKLLQKYLDRAVREKVIHKNKASRVKSKYAQKVTALKKAGKEEPKPAGKSKSSDTKISNSK